jgi:hypothetical protein
VPQAALDEIEAAKSELEAAVAEKDRFLDRIRSGNR